MFERFTDRARRVLALAQQEATLLDHGFVGTEHILLGLIHEGEGVAAKALEALNVSLVSAREQVRGMIGPAGSAPTGSPPFTPRAKKVLELSLREALQLGHHYVGTEHILLGLVREGEGVAATVLGNLGADLPHVRHQVIQLLSGGRIAVRGGLYGRVQEWPRLPTRVIPGPSTRLGSEGLEFSIIGVLLFDEKAQVAWRISGIPGPIIDLMKDSRLFSANVQHGESVAYLAVSDDLDTAYRQVGAHLRPRPDGECIGSSLFTPTPPDSASLLRVSWQGESVEVGLSS